MIRRATLILAALAAAAPAAAAPIVHTVGDLLTVMRENPVVNPFLPPASWNFLIPVAGRVTGSRGEDFESDLTIWAPDGLEHTVVFGWIARDRDNRAVPLQRSVVGPGPTRFSDIATTLGQTGMGAIAVAAVDARGEIDFEASLFGASRIVSDRGCGGTASIRVPAVSLKPAGGNAAAFPVGSEVRATLGIVNATAQAAEWTTYVGYGGGLVIEVPPYSMVQVPLVVGDGPAYVSSFPVTLGAVYVATIRNDTGSGAVVPLELP